MASKEQESQQREALVEKLKELVSIDVSSLGRRDELGAEINFVEALPFLERDFRLFRELSKVDLSSVPFNALTNLLQRSNALQSRVNEIRTFSYEKFPQNIQQSRVQLINAIRDMYDEDYSIITPVLAYAARSGLDFQRLESEARDTVAAMSKMLKDQETIQAETKQRVDATLTEVQTLARQAGVSQHSVNFKDEADSHSAQSFRWLVATAISSAITIIVASILLGYSIFIPPTYTATQAFQVAIAKVAILSFLFPRRFGLAELTALTNTI